MLMKKEFIPTAAQRDAISIRSQNLLISASAGSGKTTTMIDRIAALISEGTHIRNILALTFTTSAAADMKEKLYNKFRDRAAAKVFCDMLGEIPLADISTIHSFCADLLRKNFAECKIDPSFSVLEGTLRDMVFAEAVNETLETFYTENSTDFYALFDAFAQNRSDRKLKEIITEVYDYAVKTENPRKWLKKAAGLYSKKSLSKVEEKLNSHLNRACNFYRGYLSKLSALCHTVQMMAHKEALDAILVQISRISPNNSFQDNYKFLLAADKIDCPRKTKTHDELLHSKVKSAIGDFYKDVCLDEEFDGASYARLVQERRQAAGNAKTLISVVERLFDTYEQKKQKLSVLDFDDLEHKVNELLSDKKIAEDIADKYSYIFVDEYQDVNDLQESIIKKLAKKDNLFLVGDIKQSIYAFRHSEPSIIKARMSEFSGSNSGLKIDLQNNFRSEAAIIDFVNYIFSNCMSTQYGGLDYLPEHKLEYKSSEVRCENPERHVCVSFITDCRTERLSFDPSLMPMPYDINTPIVAEKFSNAEAEAIVIANNIAQLLACGLEYRDIVILTRGQKSEHTQSIYKKLKSLGIPVSYPVDKLDEANAGLEILVNFMSVIDNPLQDIPLAAVLNSFMYNFSVNELIDISLSDEGDTDFYYKLVAYAKTPKGGRAREFLAELERYRKLSKSISGSALLTTIINEKNAEKHIMQKAGRAAHGGMLNYLSALEEGGYAATLEGFCSYVAKFGIDKVYSGGGEENTVRMLTIHASKGLEFPAVILSGLGQPTQVNSDDAIIDKSLGVAVKYFDQVNRIKRKTLNLVAARLENEFREREESQRILYVALTRAERYLCLTGCIGDFPDAGVSDLDPYSLAGHSTYADLIATIIANCGVKGFKLNKITKSEVLKLLEPPAQPTFPIRDEELIKSLEERLNYQYPHTQAITLDYKMAASEAAKMIFEAERVETGKAPASPAPAAPPAPPSPPDDAKARNLESGTVYHKALLNIPLNTEDIAGEIKKLTDLGIMTADEEKLIDTAVLKTILELDIIKRAASRQHFREQPFMMLVSAAEVDKRQNAEDGVIVQGIIDLMFYDNEEIVIVDYKYSRLSSDRLREVYASQLKMYARAAETILQTKVSEMYIVSLRNGDVIKI